MIKKVSTIRWLIGACLAAFMFIIFPGAKFNIPVWTIMTLGAFGVYDLASALWFGSFWIGFLFACRVLAGRCLFGRGWRWYLRGAVVFLSVPLLIQHSVSGFITSDVMLVLPELIFVSLSVVLLGVSFVERIG